MLAIVGAGMAGYAAARLLSSHGYNVTVLEARDRIGGRIHTATPIGPDVHVDLGAGWIHGMEPSNPLLKLVSSVDAEVVTVRDTGSMYDSTGKELSDGAQIQAEKHVRAALAAAAKTAEAKDVDSSLGVLVDQWAARMPALNDPAAKEAFYSLLYSDVSQEYADDVAKMSAWYWDEDGEIVGDDGLFPKGYVQLFEGFETLPGVTVRLNTAVSSIAYSPTGQVTLATAADESIVADRVIVTAPLGILKAREISFSPDLPRNYYKAIDALGFGTLNKVVLRFNTVFWENSYDWMASIATTPAGAEQNVDYFNMAPYLDEPILVFFTSGTIARSNEKLSDQEQVDIAVSQLRKMYPDATLAATTPVSYAVTRWSSDPHSKGSYSYYAKGSTPKDRKTLRTPVGNRVFFAGEHTTAKFFATVHGAYNSGVDAANAVMASL